MLEAGVLAIGIVYMVATLVADIFTSPLNPRIRSGGRMRSGGPDRIGRRGQRRPGAPDLRRESCATSPTRARSSPAPSSSSSGSSAAIFGTLFVPHDPLARTSS